MTDKLDTAMFSWVKSQREHRESVRTLERARQSEESTRLRKRDALENLHAVARKDLKEEQAQSFLIGDEVYVVRRNKGNEIVIEELGTPVTKKE